MKSAKDLLNFLGNIKTFTEFEKKLANLSGDKEKGDFFELFCQIYLKIIYKKQAFKSIQLFKDIDATTLKRLNLRLGKDYGIDIVAITDSDEIWTIQVKFRQSDQLTWTELSTFRASSEKASFTMVMSNVSKVNHPHAVLTDFSSILRNEFETLTEDEFLNIKTALKGQIIKPIIFSPRPHQIEAINSAINHFRTNNLGQMIHACGTGKTLTSLWIKEALKPRNTLVYVPSLSLLKQTLEEWTKQKSSNFSIKCVCSDQSVSGTAQESDEAIVDITELGVPVTTDPKVIVEFLRATDKDKIIFSTYQSAPVILEAMRDLPQFSFNFGVFDEAHRTASKSEHLFAKSLNTPIQKKLFMTATPKLYAPHVKSRAKEEDVLLCSMDDSKLYGEVFHEIKFGEAIKLNLLSDYKIKVIIVSNEDIKELIDRRYWLDILGKEITADELAKVWALFKSLNDTNHVISFHSRIRGAKEFQILVEKTIELLKSHKKEVEDVKTYHITGEYPTYQRSKILSDFIKQKKSLVTNARCLTEGVDVPSIDGVYFVDPKQNLIDIVQAVGRAIRKKPTKYGYIIIPVFIKDEKDTEKIIEGSAFGQVWNVVEAMKDQDARLSHVIEQLQELKGKKRFGGLKSRDQAEERALKADLGNIFDFSDSILPRNIDLIEFVEKISIKTLDIVGQSWDEHFGEYKKFKEEFEIEPHYISKNKLESSLNAWAGTQRTAYNKGGLSQERINKLNSINFVWDILDTIWSQSFNVYQKFKKDHGREPTFRTSGESQSDLAVWAGDQRERYKANKITRERIDKLNSVGFSWDIKADQWEQNFNDYIKFKKEKEREPSTSSKNKSEESIAHWAIVQRVGYSRNKLPSNRITKLNSIGFIWSIKRDRWDQSFEDYKAFKGEHDREPSNKSKNEQESEMGKWITRQKIEYNKNKLPEEKITKLNSGGVIWDQKNDWWDKTFSDYKKFRNEQKREPLHTAKDKFEKDIALWITRQRKAYKKNKLSRARIDNLNLINFVWDINEVGWNQAFEDYRTFKAKYNREPSNSSKDKTERFLAHWAVTQRSGYGKKKRATPQNRIDKLNSIGFVWDLSETLWKESLKNYLEFRLKNNREPSNRSKNVIEMRSGSWTNRQRVEYNKNKLPEDRIEKLNSIGFKWSMKH